MMKPFLKTYEINPEAEKSVLIIGGVHGNEYSPLLTLMILKSSLDSAAQTYTDKIIKSITLLNGINYTGLVKGTREIQAELENSSDLNRLFVEQEESQSIFDFLKSQIDQHDIIIDIHASEGMLNESILIDINENAYPYIAWAKLSDVVYGLRFNDNQTIKKYAIRKGKVGVTVEIDGLIPINRHSAIQGAKLVVKLLQHYSPEIFAASYEKEEELHPMREIKARTTGIYSFPYIYDYAGNILEDFSSYKDKAIVSNISSVYIRPEDYLFMTQ